MKRRRKRAKVWKITVMDPNTVYIYTSETAWQRCVWSNNVSIGDMWQEGQEFPVDLVENKTDLCDMLTFAGWIPDKTCINKVPMWTARLLNRLMKRAEYRLLARVNAKGVQLPFRRRTLARASLKTIDKRRQLEFNHMHRRWQWLANKKRKALEKGEKS